MEPIIPAIVLFKVDGYVLYFLIRPDCVARNSQLAFYIHVVPLIVAVAVGLYLLVLIFWKFFSEVCISGIYMYMVYQYCEYVMRLQSAFLQEILMSVYTVDSITAI